MSKRDKKIILEKAHNVIILNLGDKVLREVSKEESTAAVWLKLDSLYMMKLLANCVYLKQRLYSFCLGSRRSIEDHIEDFQKLILDIKNIKVKVEDEDQALILLSLMLNS